MKKSTLLIFLLIAVFIACGATASLTHVTQVFGNALNTIQSPWVIIDETTSAGTEPTALGEDERKKLRVDAIIAAAASGDGEITVFRIPPTWNAVRLRSANVTEDTGNVVYDIYLGTLGGELDCDLVYAASIDFTSGGQNSMYYQIAFTLGGADGAAYVPKPGDTVTGNTSGETAVIVSVFESASTWSAGTAAGTITYRSSTGTFTNSETVSIKRANRVLASNAYKHAASDLVGFEWADTVVNTAKSWNATWTTKSPADDTIGETEVDVKGSDIMVVVPSTCTADCKLIGRGF